MGVQANKSLSEPRQYLTKAELVARSGLSPATVQRLKDGDFIPFFQPRGKGGKILFPIDAIEFCAASPSDNVDTFVSQPQPASNKKLRGPRPSWQKGSTKSGEQK